MLFALCFKPPVYKKKVVKTNVFFGKFIDQIFNVAQRVPWKFTDTPWGGAPPPGYEPLLWVVMGCTWFLKNRPRGYHDNTELNSTCAMGLVQINRIQAKNTLTGTNKFKDSFS